MPPDSTSPELPLTVTCDNCDATTPVTQSHDVEHEDQHQTWCSACNEESAVECHDCTTRVSVDGGHSLGGNAYCRECFDENVRTCQHCDDVVHTDDTQTVRTVDGRGRIQSETWCDRCVDQHTSTCDHCGTVTDDDHVHTVNGEPWCYSCYENSASCCDDCGEMFPTDDMHYRDGAMRCESCHDAHDDDDDDDALQPRHTHKGHVEFIRAGWIPSTQPYRLIGLPHVKPPCCNNRTCPTRTVSGELVPAKRVANSVPFFGVENEVEVVDGAPLSDVVRHMREQLGALYGCAESDGSLNRGIEFVTNAGTLQAHRDAWSTYTPHPKTRGHDTTTCGLHVHVSRYAFSRLTWHKFVTLTHGDDAVPHLDRLFRRKLGGQWIEKNSVGKGDKAKCTRRGAVNFLNEYTVEIRWPKGTTKGATIVATVELIHALLRYCEITSLVGLSWAGFVAMVHDENSWLYDETATLRPYMAQRLHD